MERFEGRVSKQIRLQHDHLLNLLYLIGIEGIDSLRKLVVQGYIETLHHSGIGVKPPKEHN